MLAKHLISTLLNSGLQPDEVAGYFRLPIDVVEGCHAPDTDQVAAINRWLKLAELAATETWRPVVGYEGLYEVSTFGNVRSNGKLLKPQFDSRGYLRVTLCNNAEQKPHRVHRLVAVAFLGESKLHVLHNDDDKTNNRLSNLSFGTHSKNNIDAIKTGVRHKHRSSTYCGVSWDTPTSKWRAVVNRKHVGRFDNEADAAAAANLAIVTSNSELPLNWLTQ